MNKKAEVWSSFKDCLALTLVIWQFLLPGLLIMLVAVALGLLIMKWWL